MTQINLIYSVLVACAVSISKKISLNIRICVKLHVSLVIIILVITLMNTFHAFMRTLNCAILDSDFDNAISIIQLKND